MSDPTLHKLQERVKELTALHRTARILQDDSRPVSEVLRDVVQLLPMAWQYPEIAAARISCGDTSESTDGFTESPWIQSARFTTRGGEAVAIQIAYLEERSTEDEGPFLAEERELLDSLAEMLHSYLDRKLADAEIRAAYDNLERLVETRTAQLRRLATEASLADARERREIAVDLHDHIIQEFAFIKLRIAQFRGDAVFCGFERNLEEIISLLEGAIRDTRKLTFEISAPILYELGLPAALEWLAEQYEARHKLKVKVKLPRKWKQLPEAIRVTLFRCVRELLTNVVKYAEAKQAVITLSHANSRVELVVSDDGKGFDVRQAEAAAGQNGGFGLFSIRERLRYFGGEMTVRSETGKGTTVTLSLNMEK